MTTTDDPADGRRVLGALEAELRLARAEVEFALGDADFELWKSADARARWLALQIGRIKVPRPQSPS